MAFRYSGKNWEGRVWNTPASLRSFGAQLDDQYPSRPTATDGTVASQNHDKVSPTSDHRPHPTTGPGVVRALDGTVTQEQGSMITEALRKSRDVRIKYVIWNRRSFSPNTDWEWEDHGGAPHDKHFHVSFRGEHDQDDSLWDLGQQEEPVPPLTEKEENTVEDLLAALEAAGAMTRASRQVLLKKMAEPVTGTPGLVDGDVVKLVKEV